MEQRQAGLGQGETLQRGLAQQSGGPPEIPVWFQGVIATQLKLGSSVALSGGFPDPAQRGPFVGRDAPAGDVMQPQIQLGAGITDAGPLMEFGQGGGDGLIPIRTAGEAEAQHRRVVKVTVARKGMSGCGILESLQ